MYLVLFPWLGLCRLNLRLSHSPYYFLSCPPFLFLLFPGLPPCSVSSSVLFSPSLTFNPISLTSFPPPLFLLFIFSLLVLHSPEGLNHLLHESLRMQSFALCSLQSYLGSGINRANCGRQTEARVT